MPYQTVAPSWKLTWLLSALLTLSGCGAQRVVYRDREVIKTVPVRAPLDARLTADCVPDAEVPPSGPLPVGEGLRRLDAVESALADCRARLGELRSIK